MNMSRVKIVLKNKNFVYNYFETCVQRRHIIIIELEFRETNARGRVLQVFFPVLIYTLRREQEVVVRLYLNQNRSSIMRQKYGLLRSNNGTVRPFKNLIVQLIVKLLRPPLYLSTLALNDRFLYTS